MKIGDRIPIWFPGGVIVAIRPYTGSYPQWFTHIVTVTASRTRRGTLEVAV